MTYGNQLEFRSQTHAHTQRSVSEYGMSDTHFDTQVCMKKITAAINQNKKKERKTNNNNNNNKSEQNKLRCDQFGIASLSI